jgi:hypothetical protein
MIILYINGAQGRVSLPSGEYDIPADVLLKLTPSEQSHHIDKVSRWQHCLSTASASHAPSLHDKKECTVQVH